MTRTFAILGLAFALGACASSNTSVRQAAAPADDADARIAADGPGSERICKSTPIAGSRAMKRVCHTRDEWAQMRRNAEETVRQTQQRPTGHFENQGGGG